MKKENTNKSKGVTFQSVWIDAYEDSLLRSRINKILTETSPKNLIFLNPVARYKDMIFDEDIKKYIWSSLGLAKLMINTNFDECLGRILKLILIAIYCKDIPSEEVKYIRDNSWEIVNQVRWSNKEELEHLSILKACLFLLEDKVTSLQKV